MQVFLEEGNTEYLISHSHLSINKHLAFPKNKFEMRERERSRKGLPSWEGESQRAETKGFRGWDGASDSPPDPLE